MRSDELARLYRIRFPQQELDRKNAIWRVICKEFLQQFVDVSNTVVDIACGFGEFSNNIVARRRIAIDVNPDAQRFLNPDIEFHQCAVADLNSVVAGDADRIFTSNFLEHLPDKEALVDFLDKVLVSLKPGGKYLILGPNLRYLPGQYWDFFDHQLGLTHLSLCEALELKGFAIELCLDRFLPYTTQGALPTHPALVRFYLKVPIAWRFFGKQFFIVARKPG